MFVHVRLLAQIENIVSFLKFQLDIGVPRVGTFKGIKFSDRNEVMRTEKGLSVVA